MAVNFTSWPAKISAWAGTSSVNSPTVITGVSAVSEWRSKTRSRARSSAVPKGLVT